MEVSKLVFVVFGCAGLVGLLGLATLAYQMRRGMIRERRAENGQCTHCGYDLQRSLGRCPECGTEPNPHEFDFHD